MGEVRAWVPAAELRPGDVIVWARGPQGVATVSRVEKISGPRVQVTFGDGTRSVLFPETECSVLNRRLEQPQQIKAAADLKVGDRVRWYDGETRTVQDVYQMVDEQGMTHVVVYIGGPDLPTGWYWLSPFMAVVMEGTDG
jgi:hypothetical protein